MTPANAERQWRSPVTQNVLVYCRDLDGARPFGEPDLDLAGYLWRWFEILVGVIAGNSRDSCDDRLDQFSRAARQWRTDVSRGRGN